MTSSVTLSLRIIEEIFGHDFVTALIGKQETERTASSSKGKKDSVLTVPESSGRKRAGKAIDQKSVGGFIKGENHDGQKPNKSPRNTTVVPPTQQLTVDVGEALLPIRNFIRRRAGYPIPPVYAQAPPPSDPLGELMNEKLQSTVLESNAATPHIQPGRLGPKVTKFDVAAHLGSFVMTADRLGMTSQCNFGSVRANVCLFKGKWQYEIQLGSKGVMQVGWATLTSKFSQEKGVGDTTDSYGYDGKRLRKWNGVSEAYGETWQAGDIIGCLIDMNDGIIEYQRNGKSLGVAFTNVRRGPGIAYFPAVSLAWGENVVANFGARPLQFPVEGYSPIQAEMPAEDSQVPTLFSWLENTLRIFPTPEDPSRGLRLSRDDYETIVVVTNRIFQFLAPSLNSAFIVEQTFIPFYARAVGLPQKVAIQDNVLVPEPESHVTVHLLLDIMWTFLEESEMKKCVERMCIVFMNSFRSNSLSLCYPFQIHSLRCLIAMSSHRKTRRYLIHHILFDQIKLMHFLHIRPVDDEVLKIMMPNAWWPGKTDMEDPEAKEYKATCDVLKIHIQAVEEVQMQFLRTLLTNADGSERRPSSRSVFLRKFRAYIHDSIRPGALIQHPLNRALCAFFRVLKITMLLLKEEGRSNDNSLLPDFPSTLFYDMTIDFHDSDRLGGLANYLYKTYHEEVSKALNLPDYCASGSTASDGTPTSIFGFQDFGNFALTVGADSSPSETTAGMEEAASEEASEATTAVSTTTQRNVQPIEVDGSTSTSATRTSSAIIESASVGVGVSNSPSVPLPAISRNLGANTSTGEGVTGIRTPQVGVIHPPVANFTTMSHTENVPDLRAASATSSAEDMFNTVPRMTALIAGTPSGTNLMIPVYDFPRETTIRLLPGGMIGFSTFDRVGARPNNPAVALINRDSGMMDTLTSLRELLDDTVMIFSCGVTRHVEKIVTLRRSMEEHVKSLEQAQHELNEEGLTAERRVELQKTMEDLTRKLEEHSRHMAWVQSGVFTPERQRLAFELLKVVLRTLNSASAQGILFVFVPEYYVTTLIHLTWLLLSQFHPTVNYNELPGIDGVLSEVAEFVAIHFTDPRIATADTKDTLTLALSAFICDKKMLTCLEQMSEMSKKRMVKSLLRPYENRAWAQSNWMLLRIWQGSGFAFQYPNTLKTRLAMRPQYDEFGVSNNLPPNPSVVFQNLIGSVLVENPRAASNYIHSVLNQLNWAFSEFVGLLQEIYTRATRTERVIMESRQLKICCTCHELTQALLRVVEMVVTKSPEVLTDQTRDSSEVLLNRLCVLISQLLNRIGSTSGTFAQVVELGIPGIESISYFPILSSVAGITVALVELEMGQTDSSSLIATKAILHEPSFQVSSLDFLMGKNMPPNTPEALKFSLSAYIPDDITEDEVKRFEAVVEHISSWAPRLEGDNESISDDDICTICYAYAKSTTFKPCNHRSCRSCIIHHIMNRGECFFCKGVIEKVIDDDGVVLHDVNAPSQDSDSEVMVGPSDQ